MKYLWLRTFLIITILTFSTKAMANNYIFPALPLEIRQKHKKEVQAGVEKRWKKVVRKKSTFAPYTKKSKEEILEEAQHLHLFRQNLWYKNPHESPHICQMDYMVAQDLLEKGYYRLIKNIAFEYNCTDSTYNASTILLEGYHFIAMQEPNEMILNLFFKFLINQQVSLLVRVKPDNEFLEANSVRYWEGRLLKKPEGFFLNIMHTEIEKHPQPTYIPYCYTDEWIDNKDVDLKELYRLVQEARKIYAVSDKQRPIACHCASGVGRTGTFIAAFILAELIDKFGGKKIPSIEKIVLKLSIQRPNMVGTAEQYLLLYRFVDYYLDVTQKNQN